MDFRIKGKVAIVCAASRGLGRASAMALAREGTRLAICSRSEESLNDTASAIRRETGVQVLPVVCDLTRKEDIEELVERTVETFKTIDILVTNVGHPQMSAFNELAEEDWQHGYESVLLSVIRLCHLAIPHMQRGKWGRIVHITSVAVKEPSSPYLISGVFRAAVAALSKALSREFGRAGILVNTVCPGMFRTPLGEALIRDSAEQQDKSPAVVESEIGDGTAIGRIGESEELGALVAFLCGDSAGNITGQAVTADGGALRGLY